jgi:hypothetical protein
MSCALPAGAQTPVPLAGEFQVNDYTADVQLRPVVATAADGDFVVVWDSVGSPGTDSSLSSIQGRRYSSDGTPLGSQFQVNTYTPGNQFLPSVAMEANGDFVVVWESYGPSTDYDRTSIQAQRYRSNGMPVGSQFQVNTYTPGSQRDPSVALDRAGDFVVVWSGEGAEDYLGIHGRRFAANGTALGSELQINSDTTGFQGRASVAMDTDGDFVVVWEGTDLGADEDGFGVQGRRFSRNGTALGPVFQVNTYTTYFQGRASVAIDADGGFVVVWVSNGSSGTDADAISIQGQRYASDGATLDSEFQVNVYTTGFQNWPHVAAEADGDFVVTWMSGYFGMGPDGSGAGIQGQRYASDGAGRGTEFQVNAYTPDEQGVPSVAAQAGDDFVVVWHGYVSSGTDTSGYRIQGRRFGEPNQPPFARCDDVTIPTHPGACNAAASVDGGSSDPDGDPVTLEQDPSGPYPPGGTTVTLTATDSEGASSSCQATVTVVDDELPEIACNAPPTILRSATPISFVAAAADNCSAASVSVTAFDCFGFTKKGKRVERRCDVTPSGDTITISRARRVCSRVQWTVLATDVSGNESSAICEVIVDKKRRRPYRCPPSIR